MHTHRTRHTHTQPLTLTGGDVTVSPVDSFFVVSDVTPRLDVTIRVPGRRDEERDGRWRGNKGEKTEIKRGYRPKNWTLNIAGEMILRLCLSVVQIIISLLQHLH